MKYLIILIAVTTNVLAEIPNTFTPGAPAYADEVNANFDYLEKNKLMTNYRITKLEGPNSGCRSNANQIQFTYRRQLGTLGQTLIAGVSPYVIVRVPFVDMPTGDRYAVTLPWRKFQNMPLVTKWSEDPGQFCSATTISGYPARLNTLEFRRQIRLAPPNYIKDTVVYLTQNIEILIGSTILTIEILAKDIEVLTDTPISNPNDYAEAFVFDSMIVPTSMLSEVESLIGYINIEKLP